MTLYRSGNHWIWSTWAGAIRLPRVGDPLWRRLASRPRVLRDVRRIR